MPLIILSALRIFYIAFKKLFHGRQIVGNTKLKIRVAINGVINLK
jgi:hypothetical protein